MLITHRWFSLAVIVTMALGIGVNTTVFTLVNAVLFKPVPVPNGELLMTVNGQSLAQPDRFSGLSYPDFLALREQQTSFVAIEAVAGDRGLVSENDRPPERFNLARISPGLFGMIQMPPVLGRGFAGADGEAGAPGVLLISHRVWKNRYESDPGVIGRSVRVNGAAATIVGVMPEGFLFPQREDLWMPLAPVTTTAGAADARTQRNLQGFALLKAGVTREAAAADLAVIAHRLATEYPDSNKDSGVAVRSFHDTYNGGEVKAVFLTMLLAVGFVLLIACANVANLMLSRAIAREREITVRAALGATRRQLIRQLLVESVLLSCIGGLAGFGLTAAGVHAFDLATQDVGKPYWVLFELDYRVFGYFAIISVVSGLVFGLVPALRASRVDVHTAMKEGARSSGTKRGGRLTGILVAFQFALTVVLLVSAGLMMRSFFQVQTINPFVPVSQIFTAGLDLPSGSGERYAVPAARQRLHDDLLPRLAALPGVTHAAAVSSGPGLGGSSRRIEFDDRPINDPATEAPLRAGIVAQSPGYLDLINVPILQGRGFNATDGEAGKEAAVVTRDFAARHWPGREAIGQRFRLVEGNDFKRGPWMTVVGVASDLNQRPQDDENLAVFFVPQRQVNFSNMMLMLRTPVNPAALAPLVRSALRDVDAELPLYDLRTLQEALDRNRWFLAVFGTLFFAFALIALLMASIGLYAVVAQATARRTREIGIRMALGSSTAGIIQLVLSRGLRQLGAGLIIGLAGAVGFARLISGEFLIGVSPQDPLVFSVVTVMLVAVGLLACWLPARRAARIKPTEALRTE